MPTSISDTAVLRAPSGKGHSWGNGQREGRAFVLKDSHETEVTAGSHSPCSSSILCSFPHPILSPWAPPLSALTMSPLPLPPRPFSQRAGER